LRSRPPAAKSEPTAGRCADPWGGHRRGKAAEELVVFAPQIWAATPPPLRIHPMQQMIAEFLGGYLNTWQLIAILVLIVLIIVWVVVRRKQ